METLQSALFSDHVPHSWAKLAYPSTKTLPLWYLLLSHCQHINLNMFTIANCYFHRFNDLLLSCQELDSWTQDFTLPAVVWLSGLFNPQSFLTGEATFIKIFYITAALEMFTSLCSF